MIERKIKYGIVALVVVAILVIAPFLIVKGLTMQGLLCLIIGLAGIWIGYFLKNKIVRNISIVFLIITLIGGSIFFTLLYFSDM